MLRILEPKELAKTIAQVRESYDAAGWYHKVVVTSGFFAPLHLGHLSYLKDATRHGNIWIAIVNGDKSLKVKPGRVFLPAIERASIVGSIKYVHYVTIWDEPDVSECLNILRPNIFAKGGDRNKDTMNKKEINICRQINCDIIYGVGGSDKKNSSSEIIKKMLDCQEQHGV